MENELPTHITKRAGRIAFIFYLLSINARAERCALVIASRWFGGRPAREQRIKLMALITIGIVPIIISRVNDASRHYPSFPSFSFSTSSCVIDNNPVTLVFFCWELSPRVNPTSEFKVRRESNVPPEAAGDEFPLDITQHLAVCTAPNFPLFILTRKSFSSFVVRRQLCKFLLNGGIGPSRLRAGLVYHLATSL